MPSIKDSGKRIQMAGMVRDVADDKTKYHLVLDGPMFERWAKHLTNGAKKYSERNWMGAYTHEEKDRFKESALRHFLQWYRGDFDEDHAAAVFFNINGAEYVEQWFEVDETSGETIPPDEPDRRTGHKTRRVCYIPQASISPGRRNNQFGRRVTDTVSFTDLPTRCQR